MCLWKYNIQIELTNKIYLFMPNDVFLSTLVSPET